jgi:hypothetical protein
MITQTLDNLTRDEARAIATKLGVPRGRNRADTIKNLVAAVETKKARLSVTVTIRSNPHPEASYAPALFSKKFRTHKPNKVLVA